jgi:hypothetical protein
VDYFKELGAELGMPYQNLINLFLTHLLHFALQSRQNLLILQAAIGSDDKS